MSAPVEQGETFQYRWTVTDASGVAVDAGTVTAAIRLPDNTTASPSVTHAGTGLYDIDYTTSQVGRHALSGSATGGALGSTTAIFDDVFNVENPGRFIVGFDDARTALRGTATITTVADREQLRWLCLVASDVVEDYLDRVITRQTFVETYNGRGYAPIILRHAPVLSITTVTENGTTLSATDYIYDDSEHALYRGSSGYAAWSASSRQNVVVTYVCGVAAPSPSVRQFALEIISTLWQESQQAPHPILDQGVLLAPAQATLSSLLPTWAHLRNMG